MSDLEMLKFDKNDLVPMIIQDVNSGVVLSLFYANKESIKKMQETGFVWRYSRKNKKVMMKGEESGNSQKVVSVSLDCDNDALLVKIIPNGPACHKGTVSCFESEVSTTLSEFAILEELVETIKKRKNNPNPNSYTSKLVSDRSQVVAKLREELEELIEAKESKDIKWEAADLLYFLLIYLENQDIELKEVLKELEERRKRPSRYSSYGSSK